MTTSASPKFAKPDYSIRLLDEPHRCSRFACLNIAEAGPAGFFKERPLCKPCLKIDCPALSAVLPPALSFKGADMDRPRQRFRDRADFPFLVFGVVVGAFFLAAFGFVYWQQLSAYVARIIGENLWFLILLVVLMALAAAASFFAHRYLQLGQERRRRY